jgi:predicted ribosomally synthesized six-cysteine peptide SCIFF
MRAKIVVILRIRSLRLKEANQMSKIITLETRALCANEGGCGECQTSCQSACKTSCGVANQPCEQQEEA